MTRLIASLRGGSQTQESRSLTPESDFGAVNPEYQGISAGGAASGRDRASGEEAQLHQPTTGVPSKPNAFNDSLIAFAEFHQGRRGRAASSLPPSPREPLENQLQQVSLWGSRAHAVKCNRVAAWRALGAQYPRGPSTEIRPMQQV